MEFTTVQKLDKRKIADLLVIPFWKGSKGVEWAVKPDKTLAALIAPFLEIGDFKAKEGEVFCLYLNELPEKRLCLLGLGQKDKISTESLRKSYGSLTKYLLSKKLLELNLIIPHIPLLKHEELLTGMTEGLLLPNYVFDKLKHLTLKDADKITPLKKIALIEASHDDLAFVKRVQIVCESVYYARDLINDNADAVTPQYLAKCAQDIAKEQSHVKATIFDKARIEKEKLNLLLAVNRGSHLDPVFIILEYKGNPKSKEHLVLVGKGITYDTGGLNLKPTGFMETMKCDMSGAAACLAALQAAAQLHLKVNFTVVIPTTENGIDAKSFKPGDVYDSYAGITVEMTNSDAEGRLVLADGLAYAVRNLKPTVLMDIATLTGAIDIALGPEASGLMSTDDKLANALIKAGDSTFERVWRMPLYDDYKERLKSDIADFKSWNGRPGGSCVAATFLRQFVDEKIPWAHLDIAATAYVNEARKYIPKYATGVGVRLVLKYLEEMAGK